MGKFYWKLINNQQGILYIVGPKQEAMPFSGMIKRKLKFFTSMQNKITEKYILFFFHFRIFIFLKKEKKRKKITQHKNISTVRRKKKEKEGSRKKKKKKKID